MQVSAFWMLLPLFSGKATILRRASKHNAATAGQGSPVCLCSITQAGGPSRLLGAQLLQEVPGPSDNLGTYREWRSVPGAWQLLQPYLVWKLLSGGNVEQASGPLVGGQRCGCFPGLDLDVPMTSMTEFPSECSPGPILLSIQQQTRLYVSMARLHTLPVSLLG